MLRLFFVLSLSLCAAISPDGARTVAQVNATLDANPKNPAYTSGNFAGQEAAARAHLASVSRVARDANNQLRLLIRDAREPEVRAAQARVDDLNAYVKAVRDALSNSGQSSQQLEGLVYDFAKEHLSSGIVSSAAALVQLQRDPSFRSSLGGDNAQAAQLMNALAAIDASCKSKYAAIATAKHPSNPTLDPALWCGAAANRQSLLQRSTENLISTSLGHVIKQYVDMKQTLEAKEGFLAVNNDSMLRTIMVDRESLRRELQERYKPQMEQAGLTDVNKLMTEFDPAISGLRAEVERLAPRWQWPATGARDAGAETLARAQVARQFPGAAIRATLLRDAVFKIHKNALGIPLDRYKDGFVLYKMANEPLCRQQSFTYTETFDGTGYQRPSGVKLNYVRFLRCQ